jgi:CelD/BcsL family acetyltransferase involved in cellulose biosynthesis
MTGRPAPSLPSAGFVVERITTEEALAALEADWNRLSRDCALPNVFTTFDWFRTWHRHFAGEAPPGHRQPHVLVVRRAGAAAGIAPLVRLVSARYGITVRRLEFVGREWDYNDLIVGDGAIGPLEAVIDFLVETSEEWDVIDLRHLRETGQAVERLARVLSDRGLPFRVAPEAERCPYLPIDAPWSEMLARRSPSTRHRFRHQQTRLDRLQAEGLRVRLVEDPQLEPGLLERMVALEAQKRVGGRPSPPFLGRYAEVFRSLFGTLGPRRWCCVALMELGERPLAWHLLFRCGPKLWGYVTAYDHEYAHLSPGTMLVPAIVDYGHARGFREYDFGIGEEPYKQRFAAASRQVHRLQVWNGRWASRLRKFGYLDLRPALSRWLP